MKLIKNLLVALIFFPMLASAGQLEQVGLHEIMAGVCDLNGAETTLRTWDSRSLIIISGNPDMVSHVFMVDESHMLTEDPWYVFVSGHEGPTVYNLFITRRSNTNVAIEVTKNDGTYYTLDSEFCE